VNWKGNLNNNYVRHTTLLIYFTVLRVWTTSTLFVTIQYIRTLTLHVLCDLSSITVTALDIVHMQLMSVHISDRYLQTVIFCYCSVGLVMRYIRGWMLWRMWRLTAILGITSLAVLKTRCLAPEINFLNSENWVARHFQLWPACHLASKFWCQVYCKRSIASFPQSTHIWDYCLVLHWPAMEWPVLFGPSHLWLPAGMQAVQMSPNRAQVFSNASSIVIDCYMACPTSLC